MTESTTARVDPANVDQLNAWDGAQGAFWAAQARRFDEGVAAYQEQFLDAAGIEPASKVLDIGCGSGQTSRDAARRAAEGTVLGVDLSSTMLGLARELAEREGVANATFSHADAQVHPFPEGHFDVAVSRHGSMFFGDPLAAFTNIARALRPGGNLALLTWQPLRRNEWLVTFRAAVAAGRPQSDPGASGPFSLSEPDQVRALLTSAGFEDVRVRALSEPMYFGRDVEDAFQFVTSQHTRTLDELDEQTRTRALEGLRANMSEHQTERGVFYDSAALLIQARRA